LLQRVTAVLKPDGRFKWFSKVFWNTGGAMFRGLLFAGLPPSLLGRCEGKDYQKPMGSGPNDGLTGESGLGDPLVATGIACR
jgi:hypothetical protein